MYSSLAVFKMAAIRHVGFLKFEYFKVSYNQRQRQICVTVQNFIKIGHTVVSYLLKIATISHLGCVGHILV